MNVCNLIFQENSYACAIFRTPGQVLRDSDLRRSLSLCVFSLHLRPPKTGRYGARALPTLAGAGLIRGHNSLGRRARNRTSLRDVKKRKRGDCNMSLTESIARCLLAFAFLFLLTTSGFTESQPQDNQTVKVGPWTIATTYKADKFDNCTMSSSSPEGLGISLVRNQDGLLLLLDSPKWKLDRGKAYSVRLVAGSPIQLETSDR